MGGGGQQQQGGGDIMAALSRMMGPQSTASYSMGGPSTTATGGDPPPPIGGIDIPPADMGDQFGGAGGGHWGEEAGLSARDYNWLIGSGGNPWNDFSSSAPFGNIPPSGLPGSSQGPTQIPTFFDPQAFPYAPPIGPDFNILGGSKHMGMRKNQ